MIYIIVSLTHILVLIKPINNVQSFRLTTKLSVQVHKGVQLYAIEGSFKENGFLSD